MADSDLGGDWGAPASGRTQSFGAVDHTEDIIAQVARKQATWALPEMEVVCIKAIERSLRSFQSERDAFGVQPLEEAAKPRISIGSAAEEGLRHFEHTASRDNVGAVLQELRHEVRQLSAALRYGCTLEAAEEEMSEENKARVGQCPVQNQDSTDDKRQASTLFKNHVHEFAEFFTGIACLQRLLIWLAELEQPRPRGRLANLVTSRKFESVCAFVICLHAIQTALAANYYVQHFDEPQPVRMVVMENLFLAFYTVEILLKIAVHRWWFLVNEDMKWNWFDSFLVAFSIWDQISLLVASGGGANVAFLRSVRLIKMVKIFRMLRVMRFFRELRLMLYSIGGSLVSFFWCFVMIVFILYMFALMLVQGVAACVSDYPGGDHEELLREFGSMEDSMFSLYKATTGGNDWDYYYKILVPVGWVYTAMFVIFTAFFNFAVFNVLTGIFVDHAMQASLPDKDSMVFEMRRKEWHELAEVKRLCHQMDFNQSGAISWQEFKDRLADPTVKAYLHSLGLEVKDAYMFFETLRSISGGEEVDIDAFVEGCMKMRGAATGIDLAAVSFQSKVLKCSVVELQDKFTETMEELDRKVTKVYAAQKWIRSQAHDNPAEFGKNFDMSNMPSNASAAPMPPSPPLRESARGSEIPSRLMIDCGSETHSATPETDEPHAAFHQQPAQQPPSAVRTSL